MDHLHSTATEHRKRQHLSFEHRVLIQTRLKEGYSPNRIAGEIGCAPNAVRNEIKRGTVALYKVLRFKAVAGKAAKCAAGTASFTGKPISSRFLRESSWKTDGPGCLCWLRSERRPVHQRSNRLHKDTLRLHGSRAARHQEQPSSRATTAIP